MTVPLDTRQDIREMDARGVPRSEIARRFGLSRDTVAKYADTEDMPPAAPLPQGRPHPAADAHAAWIDSVLEADLGTPFKQRHTARRVYDRLVAERSYEGSYSSVRRHAAAWRRERARDGGDGYLELDLGARRRPGRLRQLPRRARGGADRPEAAGGHAAALERQVLRGDDVGALGVPLRRARPRSSHG